MKRATAITFAVTALSLLVIGCSGSELDAGVSARGEQLYALNCQSCHGDAATGAGRLTATIPSHRPGGHTWHHADGQHVDIVLGRFTYPGREMPSFAETLTEQQVEEILAYIKTGWSKEILERQADVSAAWESLQ